MTTVDSTIGAAPRRYLGLHLPWLPAERASRSSAAPRDAAFALTHNVAGGIRIAAVSAAAAPLGLTGLTLADARARLPALVVVDHDPVADAALLAWLADGCERWSPSVAVDDSAGVVVDLTGCVALDAEAALAAEIVACFAGRGVTARWAAASTPDAALALARYAANDVAGLPVAALRVGGEVDHALRRAGLTTIGMLATRPRAPLAARFGAEVATRLARLLGEEDIRIVPRRTVPAVVAEHRFAEPVATVASVMAVLDRLIRTAAGDLARRGAGGRRFEAALFRSDGHVARLAVDTSAPTRDAAVVARLIDERIAALADPLDPGFGFDLVRLAVPVTQPLAEAQLDLAGGSVTATEIAGLVDRLSTRLGSSRVRRLVARGSHIPEQAAFDLPRHAVEASAWPPRDTPPRPLHLFTPPQRIDVVAEVPDGPPHWFRWHRVRHDVRAAEGPERIAAEWWRRRDGQGLTRDYYRVENAYGRRFWVFRHGLYGVESAHPDWYLHGLFA